MTNEELQIFLSDNNISCSTCRFYTGNTHIDNVVDDVCGNESNKQTAVYQPQFLRFEENNMCSKWEELKSAEVLK